MAGKVCKVYLVRPREAWYQLSREEQDTRFAKVGDALASVGGKPIVRCESYWDPLNPHPNPLTVLPPT